MTEEQCNALVKQLEIKARRNPSLYKLQVGLLAMLGYIYIFVAIAFLNAAFALLILMVMYSQQFNWGVGIISIGIIGIIARSLWIPMSLPNGVYLNRKRFPLLFRHLDILTKKLKAPRCHHVILTRGLNAGIMQISRLGILGWQKNYLLIGLPLMQALSPNRFRAVLAHEFGHLSGNHSAFAGWIYHQRQIWVRILNRVEEDEQHWAIFLFEKFLEWYVPFFSAYSFVLARADEYEADRCAKQIASSQIAAEALIDIEVKAQKFEEAWSKIYRQAQDLRDPPTTSFGEVLRDLTAESNPEKEREWLSLALAQQTDRADTHPCLQDRLKALRYPTRPLPALPHPGERSAAEEYLQQELPQLTSALAAEWRTSVHARWNQHYFDMREYRIELAQLEHRAETVTLTPDETWTRVCLKVKLDGTDEIKPLLTEILTADDRHVGANLYWGQLLLEAGDDRGIGHIRKAISEDESMMLSGCRLIVSFLQQQGRFREAEQYRQQAKKYSQDLISAYPELVAAQKERSEVTPRDRFKPHGLSVEEARSLRQQIACHREVEVAYFVQKVVKHLPKNAFYVLAIRRKPAVQGKEANNEVFFRRFTDSLTLPGETWMILFGSDNNAVEKAIQKAVKRPFYVSAKRTNSQNLQS